MSLALALSSGLRAAGQFAARQLPGLAAGLVGSAIFGDGEGSQQMLPTPQLPMTLPGGARGIGLAPGRLGAGGVTMARIGAGTVPFGFTGPAGFRRRRKRMNVTNVRALRRSLRRVEGFEKVCRRVLTITTGRQPKVRFKRRRRS